MSSKKITNLLFLFLFGNISLSGMNSENNQNSPTKKTSFIITQSNNSKLFKKISNSFQKVNLDQKVQSLEKNTYTVNVCWESKYIKINNLRPYSNICTIKITQQHEAYGFCSIIIYCLSSKTSKKETLAPYLFYKCNLAFMHIKTHTHEKNAPPKKKLVPTINKLELHRNDKNSLFLNTFKDLLNLATRKQTNKPS